MKRMTLVFAIASLALVLTSNAFGQPNNRKSSSITTTQQPQGQSKANTATASAMTKGEVSLAVKSSKPKNPGNYIGETEKNVGGQQKQSRRGQTSQYNPKELGIDLKSK